MFSPFPLTHPEHRTIPPFYLPLPVWLIRRAEIHLSHWSTCPLDGGRGSLHSSACWHGNKWGLTGSWQSSGYGFFNLPNASHWQRLITRWHGAVMFTLSHLFVEPREGAGGWRARVRFVCSWDPVRARVRARQLRRCRFSLRSRCYWECGRYLRPWGRPPPH